VANGAGGKRWRAMCRVSIEHDRERKGEKYGRYQRGGEERDRIRKSEVVHISINPVVLSRLGETLNPITSGTRGLIEEERRTGFSETEGVAGRKLGGEDRGVGKRISYSSQRRDEERRWRKKSGGGVIKKIFSDPKEMNRGGGGGR